MDKVLNDKVDYGEVPITQKQYPKLSGDGELEVTMPEKTYSDKMKFKEKYTDIFPQHLLNNPNMTIIPLIDSTSTKDNVFEKRLILKKRRPLYIKKQTVKPTLDTNLDGLSGQGKPSTSNAINEPRSRSQSPDLQIVYSFQRKETSDTLTPVQPVVASISTKTNLHEKQVKQPILKKTQLLLNNRPIRKPTLDTSLDGVNGHEKRFRSNTENELKSLSQWSVFELAHSFQDKDISDILVPVEPVVSSPYINANMRGKLQLFLNFKSMFNNKLPVKPTLDTNPGGVNGHRGRSNFYRAKPIVQKWIYKIVISQFNELSDTLDPIQPFADSISTEASTNHLSTTYVNDTNVDDVSVHGENSTIYTEDHFKSIVQSTFFKFIRAFIAKVDSDTWAPVNPVVASAFNKANLRGKPIIFLDLTPLLRMKPIMNRTLDINLGGVNDHVERSTSSTENEFQSLSQSSVLKLVYAFPDQETSDIWDPDQPLVTSTPTEAYMNDINDVCVNDQWVRFNKLSQNDRVSLSKPPILQLVRSIPNREISDTLAPVKPVVVSTSTKANVHDTNFSGGVNDHGEHFTSNTENELKSLFQSPYLVLLHPFEDEKTSDTLAPVKPVVGSTSTKTNVHDTNFSGGVIGHGVRFTSNTENQLKSLFQNPDFRLVYSFPTSETSDTLPPVKPAVASTSTKDNVHEKRLILKKRQTVKPTLNTNLDGLSGQGEPSTSNAINEPRSRSQSPDLQIVYSFQRKETSDTLTPVQPVASISTKANVHEKQVKQPIMKKTQLLLNNRPTGKPTLDTNLGGVNSHGERVKSNTKNQDKSLSQWSVFELAHSFQDKEISDILSAVKPVVASPSTKANVYEIKFDNVRDHGEPSTSNATNELGSRSENRNLKIYFFQSNDTQKETSDTLDPGNRVKKPVQFFRFVLNEKDILEVHNPGFVKEMLSNLRTLMKKKLTVAELAALKNNKSSFFPQE